MYGTLMNEEHSIYLLESMSAEFRYVYLLESPTSAKHPNRQTKSYVGFTSISDQESGVRAYDIGCRCKIKFPDDVIENPEPGEPDTIPRETWNAMVIPDLPGVNAPGNITLLIYRPFNDEHEVPSSRTVTPDMPGVDVQVLIDSSDLSARRLINGINRARNGDKPLYEYLHHIIPGLDHTPRSIGTPNKPFTEVIKEQSTDTQQKDKRCSCQAQLLSGRRSILFQLHIIYICFVE